MAAQMGPSQSTESDSASKVVPYVALLSGHGGLDRGSLSKDGQTQEKDLNRDITARVSLALSKLNVPHVNCNPEDTTVGNEERAKLVEDSGAQVAISIHSNYYRNSSVTGPEVLVYGEQAANSKSPQKVARDPESAKLASDILSRLKPVAKSYGSNDNRLVVPAEWHELKRITKARAVIVEADFINNSKYRSNEEYKNAIAESIALAVAERYWLESQADTK